MKYFQMTSLLYLVFSLIVFIFIRMGMAAHLQKQFYSDTQFLFCQKSLEKQDVISLRSTEPTVSAKSSEAFVMASEQPVHRVEKLAKKSRHNASQIASTRELLNINTASKEAWEALYGIGDVLSTRILKFRDRLGGFYSINQLQDVYGLAPETYDGIKDQLYCSGAVTKLDPAQATFKELLRHPYLNYEEVKLLKNYIRQHKRIVSLEALVVATNKTTVNAQKLINYIRITPESTS